MHTFPAMEPSWQDADLHCAPAYPGRYATLHAQREKHEKLSRAG